jgi:hypothetical protein
MRDPLLNAQDDGQLYCHAEYSEASILQCTRSRVLKLNGRPSFQAGALRRVGALDETAFVELAHNTVINDVFDF